jgi:glutamyl-tRNA reductase
MHTVNMRVTHHKADIPTLEMFAFQDLKKSIKEIFSLPSIKECVIIQTCNRVEIFVASDDVDEAFHDIRDYIARDVISKMKQKLQLTGGVPPENIVEHVKAMSKRYHEIIETDFHTHALHHLLRLTSGLESMIVGEDQILGQVKDAYQLASDLGTVGPHFENIFTKAINVGKVVRTKTKINKGAVSIGSAAVELAESVLGTLKDKDVLLVGAGEMGKLVAKSLREKDTGKMVVANRTYEKGVKVAEELGGEAIAFEDVEKGIREADLVITATAAPRVLFTKEKVEKALEGRKRGIVIIDVAIPRDVDEGVGEIEGVRLFNIDGLREIAEKNKLQRKKEIVKVEKIIDKELALLVKQIYRIDVEDVVKNLFTKAERIRQRELAKALRMLGDDLSEKERSVLDDLTRVIITKTVAPIADNVRRAAEVGDSHAVSVAQRWFVEEMHHRRKHVSGKKNEKAQKD